MGDSGREGDGMWWARSAEASCWLGREGVRVSATVEVGCVGSWLWVEVLALLIGGSTGE